MGCAIGVPLYLMRRCSGPKRPLTGNKTESDNFEPEPVMLGVATKVFKSVSLFIVISIGDGNHITIRKQRLAFSHKSEEKFETV